MANEIPTFTPPAPTFTPPSAPSHNGPTCHFHTDKTAVTRCAKCGKYICQDCAETYTVDSGDYAGKALCYDCSTALINENVKLLKKQKRSILFHYILTFIGMFAGLMIGLSIQRETPDTPWYVVLIAAFVGGTLWTFTKNMLRIAWGVIKAAFADGFDIGDIIWISFGVLWAFIKSVFISVWGTIQKLFYYTKYLIRTSGFIKSDTEALRQMADYMEYTLVMSRNVGVDLATLMNEGSDLYDNSYAQNVARNGEQGAADALRTATATFDVHGQIIRNFRG